MATLEVPFAIRGVVLPKYHRENVLNAFFVNRDTVYDKDSGRKRLDSEIVTQFFPVLSVTLRTLD